MLKAKVRKIPSLLIVDDDNIFRKRLLLAIEDRGYRVSGAASVDEAIRLIDDQPPDRVVVDLRMPGDSGLELVRKVKQRRPEIEFVVLTGYGSIPTTKEAIRLGAKDYLTKPADADQILAAFGEATYNPADDPAGEEHQAPSLARVEWEHIQRVLADCDGNISKAARVLGIHRRSLQRKLQKHPPMT